MILTIFIMGPTFLIKIKCFIVVFYLSYMFKLEWDLIMPANFQKGYEKKDRMMYVGTDVDSYT